FVFHGYFIEPTASEDFWKGAIAFREHLAHATHEVPTGVKLSTAIVMLLGLYGAWLAYVRSPALPGKVAATFAPIYDFLFHKWYIDELYDLL
ncbi:hypothetical protein, partial [Streptomyces scabiei]|uniref:hypothetical protein n=1 Tax=Streptomyces scabiei TaxID=1930 RepID=UPI0038F5E4B6